MKKLLSLLLALVLVIGLIPVTAHATLACPDCSANSWYAGACKSCGYVCTHASGYTSEKCNMCAKICPHAKYSESFLVNCTNGYTEYACDVCGKTKRASDSSYTTYTQHEFVDGKCTRCIQVPCQPGKHTWKNGVCTKCKGTVPLCQTHTYNKATGMCTACGYVCPHTVRNVILNNCVTSDYETLSCAECGNNIAGGPNNREGHIYGPNGKCTVCSSAVTLCTGKHTFPATRTGICSKCEYVCPHNGEVKIVYGKCTEKGQYDSTYCADCNKQISSVPMDRTNHSPVDGVCIYCKTAVVICDVHESWDSSTGRCVACGTLCEHENYGVRYKAYTDYICNIGGIVNKICENCGKIVGSFNVKGNVAEIGPEGHAYDMETEGEVIKAATCTETGIKVYRCVMSVCKNDHEAVKEVVIPKIAHTPVELPAVAPTCTEDGKTAGSKCSVCTEVLVPQKPVSKTGHAFDANGKCSTCNYQCEHNDFAEQIASYKSCTTPYICNNTCNDCPYQWTVTEDATGHNFSIVVKTVAATCTTDGHTTYKCSNAGCYNTEDRDVVKASHDYVEIPAVAATCTEKGFTAGEQCEKCGIVTSSPQPINPLGHAMDTGVITTPATCTEYGKLTYSCTRNGCDHSTFEWIQPGHKPGEEEVIFKAPTCTEDGLRGYTCTVCNEAVDTEVLNKLGHDYVDHEGKNPTCEEGGWSPYKTCNRCNGTFGRTEFAANGHGASVYTKENEVAADCTNAGSYDHVKRCSVCNKELSREKKTIPATGHDYKTTVTAPDCVNGGYTTYTCAKCNDTYTANQTPAKGHTYTGVVTTEPTCTEAGVKTFTCSGCNDSYTEPVTAKGHAYNGDVTTEPTCTEAGVKTFTCSGCNDSYTEPVDAKGHSYNEVVTAPTCTEDGFTTHTCSECNHSYTDNKTSAKGHDYHGVVTVKPGYDNKGEMTYTCKNCGDSYTEEISALKHNYIAVETVAPTCTEDGYTTYACDECEDTYRADFVPALGHDYEEEVTTEPTCTTKGVKTFTCTCGDSYTEEVAVLAHDYKETVTAPTCTEEGYTTYTCECGDTYTGNEVAATGHDYEEEVTTEPTCTTKGVKTYTCTCGDSYTEEVAALGHDYKETVTAPTCTEEGYTTYTCECGDTYTGNEVAATGHDYEEEVTTEPTCTTEGVKTFTCACGDSYTEAVAATGHDYEEEVTTEPTCTTEGVKTFTCACGDSYTEAVAATGHDIESVAAQAATCTEDGWKAYEYCTACDYTTKEVIKAAHIDVKQVEAQAATCTEDGWKAYEYCTACDYTTKEVIKAAHIDVKQVEAQAATCSEIGWDAYEYCTACDYTTYQEIAKNADNHAVLKQVEAQAATCTEDGWKAYEFCGECDYTTKEVIPATGHSYAYVVSTQPTETDDGVLSGTCSGCQKTVSVVLPALSEEDYTYEVVEEPTEESTGTGCYTWKDTTYGEIKIEVVLDQLPATIFGDYNSDGEITDRDVIALLWHVLFPDTNPIEGNGDFNGDGVVTDRDVIDLLWSVLFPNT